MPKVRIEILKGKSESFKENLFSSIHKALMASLKIPEHDRTIRLYELESSNFWTPADKTDNYIHIEITLFAGRTLETKKKLYQSICDHLWESNQIKGEDVTIILIESPLENWGIRGGKPASELDLGFNIAI